MGDPAVVIRPFRRDGDLGSVGELWRTALAPGWPVLPDGLAILREGYVAEQTGQTGQTGRTGQVVGMVGTDPLGAVTFVAVHPDHQRRGIGRRLLDRAVADFRRAKHPQVTAGSGGRDRIWPGVPTDRPDAQAFFESLGWREDNVVTDLVQDLQAPGLADRLAPFRPPVELDVALVDATDAEQTTEVLAFEDTRFPQWSHAFRESSEEILTARDTAGTGTGTILGTLLLAGPGRASPYWPLLGDGCATIRCVGVAPEHEGQGIGSVLVAAATRLLAARGARMCHIDWVVRVEFYRRLGYRPWRTFSMRTLPLGPQHPEPSD